MQSLTPEQERLLALGTEVESLFARCAQLRREYENAKYLARPNEFVRTFLIPAIDFERDLSPRELQVLKMYATGMSAVDISKKLFLSPKTVSTYVDRLRDKFALVDTNELRCVAALIWARLEVKPWAS